jgi:hypothetical protein
MPIVVYHRLLAQLLSRHPKPDGRNGRNPITVRITGINDIQSALQLVNVVCDAEGISYRGIQAYSGRMQRIKESAERDHVYQDSYAFSRR